MKLHLLALISSLAVSELGNDTASMTSLEPKLVNCEYQNTRTGRGDRKKDRKRSLSSLIPGQLTPSPATTLTTVNVASSKASDITTSHHRRRSSSTVPPSLNLQESSSIRKDWGSSSGHPAGPAFGRPPLSPILGTPNAPVTSSYMSLSRSPSPHPGGGWSSPGLASFSPQSGRSSPGFGMGTNGGNTMSWAAAKNHSDRVKAYPSFETRKNGFFSRQRRKISQSLPRFRIAPRDFREKEKLGRGRWNTFGDSDTLAGRIRTFLGAILRRKRVRVLLLSILLFVLWVLLSNPIAQAYRRSPMGSGSKVVVVLGSNVGGGVLDLKGATDWAIERESIKNKERYTQRWGYDLELADLVTKKRYAHEWRESWEKVDMIRESMRKYPKAEWFWWLDLNTIIMEPSYSLESHIFNRLSEITYRDINHYNPLKILHPPSAPFLDPISLSPTGDNSSSSIDLIIPQDCEGFNLGSFLVRRSQWTDRLLDIWFDPIAYEQMHLAWDHKEQDSLEYLYTNQPWIRSHVAFIPTRKINSLPPGACGPSGTKEPKLHYHQEDRDFLVNMAGCQWGRDCWGEVAGYRDLSDWLNRSPREKMKDTVSGWWRGSHSTESVNLDEEK